MDNIQIIKKENRGRKSERQIPMDDQYFNAYYHLTKKEVDCQCGMKVLSKCMLRHLKRKLHAKRFVRLRLVNHHRMEQEVCTHFLFDLGTMI